jgi:hypothetical protein
VLIVMCPSGRTASALSTWNVSTSGRAEAVHRPADAALAHDPEHALPFVDLPAAEDGARDD